MSLPFTPRMVQGPMLTWESQACQYPSTGEPGITYLAGDIPDEEPVNCLLYYGKDGRLAGILNHYAVDYPPYEQAGNANTFVHPLKRRQGIATALLKEAMRRWDIDLSQQQYSREGLVLVTRLYQRGALGEMNSGENDSRLERHQ